MATKTQTIGEIIDEFCKIKMPVLSYHECPRCHKKHNKDRFTTFNKYRNPQTMYFCSDKCKKG
jgi:hypothetical protein